MEKKVIFENLSFEGGGCRGFAYCGAIKALDEAGILSNLKRFSGTSVGALFAALLASDFSATEIINISDILDFSSLSTTGCCLSTMYNVWNNFGVNSLNKIEIQFRQILKKKVDPDITLKGLYDLTSKDLVIVTCCLNKEHPLYFHHSQFPDIKLIDAMIASISVPFIFQPRKYTFMGTSDYYVDGGLVDNYPIWVFNDLNALYQNKLDLVDKEKIVPSTLGLKLLGQDEENSIKVYNGRKQIKNVLGLGIQIINTLMMQIERSEISTSYIKQTVPIQTGDVYFLDFEITKEKRDILIQSGYDSTKKYLEQ